MLLVLAKVALELSTKFILYTKCCATSGSFTKCPKHQFILIKRYEGVWLSSWQQPTMNNEQQQQQQQQQQQHREWKNV